MAEYYGVICTLCHESQTFLNIAQRAAVLSLLRHYTQNNIFPLLHTIQEVVIQPKILNRTILSNLIHVT